MRTVMDLTLKAFGRLAAVLIVLAALLFLPAWTLNYPQAWVFLAVFALSMLGLTLYLLKKNPKMLERRLNSRPASETRRSRKILHSLASKALLLTIIVPAIDPRCRWSTVPLSLVVTGNMLVALGFLMVTAVFRENTFASAIIEMMEGQKIIATGPYAVVRHPMYLGLLITFFGIPLALGSWWALATVLPLVLVLAGRIQDEEAFMIQHLPEYAAYRTRVPYRLVPFVW
jgi:protein-S-isoprenylcysteine O-methyltransferase Ste14